MWLGLRRLAAVAVAAMLAGAGAPDGAVTDALAGASAVRSAPVVRPALDAQASLDAQTGAAIPGNPQEALPEQVSEAIADDAVVVAPTLAADDDGGIRDLQTGEPVTDPALVGTPDTPADPLAKTDGRSFIPVEAVEVKEAVADLGGAVGGADAPDTTDATSAPGDGGRPIAGRSRATGAGAAPAALAGNATDTDSDGESVAGVANAVATASAAPEARAAALPDRHGAYWGVYGGTPAFFQSDGTLFVQRAKGVIDVSEHNGEIDWARAKRDGVEGAIIRIGYGVDNLDKRARRNVAECKRLGIPFGVYWYSYAYDADYASDEGDSLASMLRRLGVAEGDLAYPAYYDLERWTWAGHTPPTSPRVYESIVNNWYARMGANGYRNLGVYSYTSYLNGPLNSRSIHAKVSWAAQYGPTLEFADFGSDLRGWQYSSQGSIDGIAGSVDVNAFGYRSGGGQSGGQVGTQPGGEDDALAQIDAAINALYLRQNGPSQYGRLNAVTRPLADGVYVKSYERADLWSVDGALAVVQFELRDAYKQQGGYARLGHPVSGEEHIGSGYWRQKFTKADVWTKGRSGQYALMGELRESYYQHGGFSVTGMPVGDQERLADGYWRQKFTKADLWSRNGSLYVMRGERRDAFNAQGGFPRLGGPTTDEEQVGEGYWRQKCTLADVWTRGGTGKYVLMGNLRNQYYAYGGFSVVGRPVDNQVALGGGKFRQRFTIMTLVV